MISYRIKEAKISFVDKDQQRTYFINKLNLSSSLNLTKDQIKVSDISLDGLVQDKIPLSFKTDTVTLRGNEIDLPQFVIGFDKIAVNGNLALNIQQIKGSGKLSFRPIDLASLPAIAQTFEIPLPELAVGGNLTPEISFKLLDPKTFASEGQVKLESVKLTAGPMVNLSDINGIVTYNLQGAKDVLAKAENLTFNLNQQSGKLSFDTGLFADNAKIKNFAISILGGSINGSAEINIPQKNLLTSNLSGSGINISQALSLINKAPQNIEGTVKHLQANFSGNLTGDIKRNLKGSLDLQLVDGAIKGWNLPGLVLKAVNNIPFITGSLYSSVPEDQKGSLDSSDTAFKQIDAKVNLDGTGYKLANLSLQAPVFSLEGNGQVGFDNNLDLATTIFFTKNFSTMLVGKISQLKNVLDDKEQLALPLKINGVPPAVIVYPNVKRWLEMGGKKILIEKSGDLLKGLLEKDSRKGLGSVFGF